MSDDMVIVIIFTILGVVVLIPGLGLCMMLYSRKHTRKYKPVIAMDDEAVFMNAKDSHILITKNSSGRLLFIITSVALFLSLGGAVWLVTSNFWVGLSFFGIGLGVAIGEIRGGSLVRFSPLVRADAEVLEIYEEAREDVVREIPVPDISCVTTGIKNRWIRQYGIDLVLVDQDRVQLGTVSGTGAKKRAMNIARLISETLGLSMV